MLWPKRNSRQLTCAPVTLSNRHHHEHVAPGALLLLLPSPPIIPARSPPLPQYYGGYGSHRRSLMGMDTLFGSGRALTVSPRWA